MTPPVNTRRVIVARRHGWEGASPALLARVFGTTVQRASEISKERCAVCDLPICGHTNDEWSGAPRSATVTIDTASEPGAWDRYFKQVHGEQGQHSNPRPSLATGDRDGAGNARAAFDVNAVTEREAMTAAKPGNVATSQVPA